MNVSTTDLEFDSHPTAKVQPAVQSAQEDRSEAETRALLDRHWTMLSLAVFIIVASFALRVRDSASVTLPWLHIELPSLCGSRTLFGVDCPGCGLTRSFIALAAGDVNQSLQYHRLGWLLALAVAAQIPYRTHALWEVRSRIVRRTWPTWFGNFLIAALLINWLWKISQF